MYRILLLIVPALLMAGCARKPVVTEAPVVPVVAPQADIQPSEPAAAPASVTVTTADGSSLETIFFDYDSAVLLPATRQTLQRNAAWLQANPQVHVTIEGHCDERGSGEYNLALGEQRAMAVRNYLVNLGVETGRLSILSYGEEMPLDPAHSETAWVKNRRAAFR